MKIFRIILLLFTVSFSQPCQDYACDSMVVRAILDSNGLDSVSVNSVSEIDTVGRIDTLRLDNLQLSILPAKIASLANLKWLDLSSNQLATLPVQIGTLTSLTFLLLDENTLTGLPSEIENLKDLTVLDLRSNQLLAIPVAITRLTNLIFLGLGNNQLTVLPVAIRQLTNLAILGLGGNQLSDLPPDIKQLKELQWLSLNNNKISTLAEEIMQLLNLTHLDLENNQLDSLPGEIGQLENLKILNLGYNALTSLPSQITRLTRLEVGGLAIGVKLDFNRLCSLPDSISSWVDQYSRNQNWKETQICPIAIEMVSQTPSNISTISISPNPFNPTTTIRFQSVSPSDVRIFDLQGHLVRTLHPEPGTSQTTWNGRDLLGRNVSSGTYIVRVNVGERVMNRRILLMR